ncbi:hypothetical protein ACQCX5_13710 [Propionibacteriaceae bacterium G57]|uniref:hypothetical protein n=1 Tax=Aestuariimicrobium sp. G57 TaxID=3418485 RepID=UPI003DA6ED0E
MITDRTMITHRTVHSLDARGAVRDWLVSPAFALDADLSGVLPADGQPWGQEPGTPVSHVDARWVLTNGPDVTPLKQRLLPTVALTRPPVGAPLEGGAFSLLTDDSSATGAHEFSDTWRRMHTADDGLLDWSEFCYTPQWRFVAATTQVEVDQADARRLVVESTGPFALWLDGELVAGSEAVRYMEPTPTEVEVWLASGVHTIALTGWQIALREVRQVYCLRVLGLPVRVVVPSPGADEAVAAQAEWALNGVGTTRWGAVEPEVLLTGPRGLAVDVTAAGTTRRVTFDDAPVTVDLRVQGTGEDEAELSSGGTGASMLARKYDEIEVRLADCPTSPISRRFPFARLPEHYRGEPQGDPALWRTEFLAHAVSIGGTGAALAGWALREGVGADGPGDWAVTDEHVAKATWMIRHRADCADFEAVGLVHLLHRVPEQRWQPGVRDRVVDALLGFKYWIDQPGLDAMCYFTENHQFVWHTAEHLVGSLFADRVFTNSGWTGAQHAEHGLALASQWLDVRLPGGFAEFDSNAYLAIDCLAAVSLVEFSPDEALARRAGALADRVLLSLATNSWRGIHGAAHGRSYVQTQRSSRLEETAPIQWVCFGMGALNDAVLPASVVATAARYQVPPVARALASSTQTTTREQVYAGQYRFEHDLLSRPYQSRVVVHRTPEAMLSSVQAYRPGLPGLQEHVWGATLSAEVQVAVTHVPNSSVSPSSRPNAWAGNRILPRVHQHGDMLVALYRPGPGEALGFTHAWFPTTHMDEHTQHGSWTAGRVGDGLVAVSCDGGARLVRAGADAAQELRPRSGAGTAWVCVIGSVGRDGSLADFVASLVEPDYAPGDLGPRVAYQRPGAAGRPGAAIEVDFDGPLLLDGAIASATDVEPGLSGPGVGRDGDVLWWDWDGQRHEIDLGADR